MVKSINKNLGELKMNEIIEELLGKGIIRSEHGIYHINDGYFIMVKNYYDRELSIMDDVYVINDKFYVGNIMSEEYQIDNISDLIISKLI